MKPRPLWRSKRGGGSAEEDVGTVDEDVERGGNREETVHVPIEQRGGEVLESVNEVFNLMAMKIDTETKARQTIED